MTILTGPRFRDAMLLGQGFVERSADILMHETTVPTSFELLTATSARLGDSLNRNIKIKYSWSVQICPKRAVRPDIYRSCTWLSPLFFPSGESTHEPGLTISPALSEALCARDKAQQHRQHIPRRVQILTRFKSQPGAGKNERCGAFAGSPQQCKIQLNF